MTGEEFLALTKTGSEEKLEKVQSEATVKTNPKLVYGIRGIANLFDCSIATANRIKKSGVIDGATTSIAPATCSRLTINEQKVIANVTNGY